MVPVQSKATNLPDPHPVHRHAVESNSVQTVIRGRVTSPSGPLGGVTVSVVGKGVVVQTNDDGSYSINADIGDRLSFSSVGYTLQVVEVSSTTVNVTLALEDTALDEVIVTAMGITREKKGLGYAVQDLQSEELMKNKSAN